MIDRLKYKFTILKIEKRILIAIVLVHFIFFSIKVCLGNYFLVDSYQYYQLAENINDYLEFYSGDLSTEINFDNYTIRPPLYSIFLLISSFFLNSKISILIAQNFLSIASLILILNIFKHYYKRINNKVLIVFIIFSFSQFIYANLLMSEILFQFLIVVLCYQFHKVISTKTFISLVYFQILIILLFLTKPVFYLFVIPNILLGIVLTKKIKKAFIAPIIPIIALVIYCNWNYQRTGSYSFSSIQTINLQNYNLKYFHINKYGEDYAIEVNNKITEISNKESSYSERQKVIKNKSLEYIKKDLISYIIFHFKGSLRMYFDPGRFDLYNFLEFKKKTEVGFLYYLNADGASNLIDYLKSQPIIILILLPLILIFNIIKFVGFLFFWIKNYKKTSLLFWVMLFIIVSITSLTGSLGASRFFVPVLPLYLLFATMGISDLISRKKLTA